MALGDGSRGRLRGEWGEEETQRVIEFGAFPRLIPGTFRLEREPDSLLWAEPTSAPLGSRLEEQFWAMF